MYSCLVVSQSFITSELESQLISWKLIKNVMVFICFRHVTIITEQTVGLCAKGVCVCVCEGPRLLHSESVMLIPEGSQRQRPAHTHTLTLRTSTRVLGKENTFIIHHNWNIKPKCATLQEKHFINAKMSINDLSLFSLSRCLTSSHTVVFALTLPPIFNHYHDYLFKKHSHCVSRLWTGSCEGVCSFSQTFDWALMHLTVSDDTRIILFLLPHLSTLIECNV